MSVQQPSVLLNDMLVFGFCSGFSCCGGGISRSAGERRTGTDEGRVGQDEGGKLSCCAGMGLPCRVALSARCRVFDDPIYQDVGSRGRGDVHVVLCERVCLPSVHYQLADDSVEPELRAPLYMDCCTLPV